MAYGNLSPNCEGDVEEKGDLKNSVSDQINGGKQADSFVVDMQAVSRFIKRDTDIANSRIIRNLSTIGSLRGGEKISPSTGNDRDTTSRVATSPRVALHERTSTPEKPAVVTAGSKDHSINPHIHHQITIMTGSTINRDTENKFVGKRFSLRRSSLSGMVDPRRILFFFATLSSMGTILLIYFTLSLGRLSGDDKALD